MERTTNAPAATGKISLNWANSATGEFVRQVSSFRDRVSRGSGRFAPEKGRYHLYGMFVMFRLVWIRGGRPFSYFQLPPLHPPLHPCSIPHDSLACLSLGFVAVRTVHFGLISVLKSTSYPSRARSEGLGGGDLRVRCGSLLG